MAPCAGCDGMGFDDAKEVACAECQGHGEIADKKKKKKSKKRASPTRRKSPKSTSNATVEVNPAAWPTLEIASLVPRSRPQRSRSPRKNVEDSRTLTDTEDSRSTRADTFEPIDIVEKRSSDRIDAFRKHSSDSIDTLKKDSSDSIGTLTEEKSVVPAGAADTDVDKADKVAGDGDSCKSESGSKSAFHFFTKLWWFQKAEIPDYSCERAATPVSYEEAATTAAALAEANAGTKEMTECIVQ